MEKLKLLVFSYNREDPQINKHLEPIHACRFSRGWDTIHIECLHLEHYGQVVKLLIFLESPFALLGIAKKLILTVPGLIQNTYTIKLRSNIDLLN